MYLEEMVRPMRQELTRIGFRELRTPQEVDHVLGEPKGATLVVVNSICGCAAANARPAVVRALAEAAPPERPETLVTVFAGQDREATERARRYFTGYEPSSPSIALLRDGKLVFMLERCDIEGRPADAIAQDLAGAFHRFCAATSTAAG